MTCQDCAQAHTAKHWGGYHADCHGCQVRSLATGPAYFSAVQANAITGSSGWRPAIQLAKP